jgi:hypothetical protein
MTIEEQVANMVRTPNRDQRMCSALNEASESIGEPIAACAGLTTAVLQQHGRIVRFEKALPASAILAAQ